jgi:hypothetical protein
MSTKKKPRFFTRKRIFIGALVTAMIVGPSYAAYKYMEPLLYQPARLLFKRLPVTYSNLSPIPIRQRRIITIPVRVIPKGAYGIRVTHKDLSKIKVTYKNSRGLKRKLAEGEEETVTNPRVQVQHVYRNGLQTPPPPE